MALSLCTNPVAFLGGVAGCVFVSSLTRQLLFWAQSSELSAFDCLFDSNGRLSSCCSGAFAICSLGSKDVVLWPQSTCSVSSFISKKKLVLFLLIPFLPPKYE